jgi:hypothetical protein
MIKLILLESGIRTHLSNKVWLSAIIKNELCLFTNLPPVDASIYNTFAKKWT